MSAMGRGRREGRREPAEIDRSAPLAEVLELLAGESAASRTFLGGLVLGALVGAALAGGSIVRGRRTGLGRRTQRR